MLGFKNILYAIDLDASNLSSAVSALEIAHQFQSHLHIIYVNDMQAGYRHPADREDAIALKVREVAPEDLLQNITLTYFSAKGDVAQEIVQYVEKHKIDLIIVGHQHRNKVYTAMFDSTDTKIIDTVSVPVLVIPKT